MVFKEILWIWWHFSKSKQNKAGSFLMIQWIGFLAQETKSSGSRKRKRKQVVNVSKKDSFLRSKGLMIRHEDQGISHLKFWKLWNSFLVFTISSELKENIQVSFQQRIHLFLMSWKYYSVLGQNYSWKIVVGKIITSSLLETIYGSISVGYCIKQNCKLLCSNIKFKYLK